MSAFVYPALTNSQISARPAAKSGLFSRLARKAHAWHRHNEEMRRLSEMTQRELADIADNEIETCREHHREHDEHADMHCIFILGEQRYNQRQCETHKKEVAFECHHARSVCLLNNP